ncbi:MAG: hypothetical protein ACKO96_07585 [Flammeovirgaceae bacterium]
MGKQKWKNVLIEIMRKMPNLDKCHVRVTNAATNYSFYCDLALSIVEKRDKEAIGSVLSSIENISLAASDVKLYLIDKAL